LSSGQKFMFDTAIFDPPEEEFEDTAAAEAEDDAPPPPPPPPGVTLTELRQSREEAFRDGYKEGLRSAEARSQDAIAQSLMHIARVADYLLAQQAHQQATMEKQIIDGAMVIARRLFPVLAEKGRVAEIAEMARETILAHADEPSLLLAVPTGTVDATKKELAAVIESRGLTERVRIVEDGELAETDCRLTWTDGGANRLVERIWNAVEQAASQVLAGRKAPSYETESGTHEGAEPANPGPAPKPFGYRPEAEPPPNPDFAEPPEWLARRIADEPSHVIRELGTEPPAPSPADESETE